MTRAGAWTLRGPSVLFVGAQVASPGCVVLAGAVGLRGVGIVAFVALLVPGAVCARIVVLA